MNNRSGNEQKNLDKKIPKEFNTTRLMDFVKKYSYPRMVGTSGERRVRRMAYKEFKELGLKPRKEDFVCSLFFSRWLLPFSTLYLFIFLCFIVIIKIIYPDWYLSDIAFILALIAAVLYIFPRTWNPHKYLQGRKYHSSNIIAFVPAKTYGNDGHRALFDDVFDIDAFKTEIDLGLEKGSTPADEKEGKKYGNIIISAHSDSKSQKYTTDIRVRIFRAAVITEILFLLFWLITVFMGIVIETAHIFTYTQIPALLITIDLAFFIIFLFKNSSGNESFGALDNATGMSAVFAMADYFKNRPLERFNLWFIQFGVEEFGQWGAANFVLKNLRHFKRGRTFNFNLDMVGSQEDDKLQILEFYGLFKNPVNPLLMSFINESADELGIELFGFNLPTGARTDRVIFTRYGFDGIDFASANAAKWTHRPEDMIDKVNPQMIQHACRIISLSAQKMDEALKKDILEEPREARFQHRGYH